MRSVRLQVVAFLVASVIFAVPSQQRSGGGRQVPPGFHIVGEGPGSGQALYGTFTGGRSAASTFRGLVKLVGTYFDRSPRFTAAFGDRDDREVQGFFAAEFEGAPVSGVMIVSLSEERGSSALLFDKADRISQSLPALARRLAVEVQPAQSGERRAPRLAMTSYPDGSGQVGLAPGWRITSAVRGMVSLSGPAGEEANFGLSFPVTYPNRVLPGQGRDFVGPYRDPVTSLQILLDSLAHGAFSRRQLTLRILEQAPVRGILQQAAFIHYQANYQGTAGEGLALIAMAPIGDLTWDLYTSHVVCPPDQFARELPTMWAMWQSYSVSQAEISRRMTEAANSMAQISAILRETAANASASSSRNAHAWDDVIRGVTKVENIYSGVRHQIDSGDVDKFLLRHPEYHIVPLDKLGPM